MTLPIVKRISGHKLRKTLHLKGDDDASVRGDSVKVSQGPKKKIQIRSLSKIRSYLADAEILKAAAKVPNDIVSDLPEVRRRPGPDPWRRKSFSKDDGSRLKLYGTNPEEETQGLSLVSLTFLSQGDSGSEASPYFLKIQGDQANVETRITKNDHLAELSNPYCIADPIKSLELLKTIGILTDEGDLAGEYRSE